MSYTEHATLERALAFAAMCNRIGGLPIRGTRRGGGRHVESPELWDGTGTRAKGWRGRMQPRRPNDAIDYLVVVPSDISREVATSDQLTVDELQTRADTVMLDELPEQFLTADDKAEVVTRDAALER